jgi:transposase
MFVRKKQNKSGVVSVQVIDKSSGTYKVVKTIGSSSNIKDIEYYFIQGKQWISRQSGSSEFDFEQQDEQIQLFFNSIKSIQLSGVDLLLGKIFDEIGFNQITDSIFKQLVLYRLVYPSSKLKTTEYLSRFQQIYWDEDQVYRYLDKLYTKHKEQVQTISYNHTLEILQDKPQVVFYDVTTIYFEIEQSDELRQTGFSKEGKHQNPQILLGLLVSQNGYPLAYEIFKGSKFEGHTMIPIIERFKEKYKISKIVVVADAGLLSNNNITQLLEYDYEFILGARIKNESKALQTEIIQYPFKNGDTAIWNKADGTRLIVAYSEKRATKDAANRERGLKRLEKQIKQGRLTKANINNKGYNKYLKMDGTIQVSIDYQKYKADAKWDGLKGYITNCQLTNKAIIDNYNHLWQIEKAFRIAKTDLKIRPIYHRIQRRIEAHICLNFVAYKIYKELERQLKEKKANISPQKAIEIASFIFTITVTLPKTKQTLTQALLKTDEQKYLAHLFNF